MSVDRQRRMLMQRLIATGLLSGVGLPLTSLGAERPRVLVLIELKGANDGLNTVVPFADPAYQRLRPTLAIPRDQVLKLDEKRGLHPAMKPLMPLWQQGDIAIVEGLGYPSPSRSHFRSIDIWETASGADAFLGEGWLAPLLQTEGRDKQFVALGEDAGPLSGSPANTLLIGNVEGFVKNAQRLRQLELDTPNPALRHLLSVQNSMQLAALEFAESKSRYVAKAAFPKHALGRNLATVAELIQTQPSISIYKVGLGSFDTHVNQLPRHRNLLAQLSSAIAAFAEEMKAAGRWGDVLLMTYSEFGRRAGENASGGTDHGTAAPHFLIGGALNGGFYGQAPSLSELQNGDLIYTSDYRSYYRSVAQGWLGFDRMGSLQAFAPIERIFG